MSVSIVTQSMGRLEHAKSTVPAMISQNTEVVFVDYSCPQRSGLWVSENCPTAIIVSIPGKQYFNLSCARNKGALAATGEWIAFVDIDIFLQPGFIASLSLARGEFSVARRADGVNGMLICLASDFNKVGGYDENYNGYGYEDIDIRRALQNTGLCKKVFERTLVDHIGHDDSLRMKFYDTDHTIGWKQAKKECIKRNKEHYKTKWGTG